MIEERRKEKRKWKRKRDHFRKKARIVLIKKGSFMFALLAAIWDTAVIPMIPKAIYIEGKRIYRKV